MRLFQPKVDVPKPIDELEVKKELQKEVGKLTKELNDYKAKIEAEKKKLDEDQDRYLKDAYKYRGELISEVGELEKKRLELESSTDYKELQNRLAGAVKKEKELDIKISELNAEKQHVSLLEEDYNARLDVVSEMEKHMAEKLTSQDVFMARVDGLLEKLNGIVQKEEANNAVLNKTIALWDESLAKIDKIYLETQAIIANKLESIHLKEQKIIEDQKLIQSQRSALKAYGKDRPK